MDTPDIVHKKLTTTEFIAFIQQPENAAYRWELIEGVPVKMPPSSQMNSAISMLLAHFLVAFVLPRKLGFVTGSDGGYRMSNGDVQQPDVAYISRARHTTLDGVVFPVAPDLAIEIISPSEESNDIVKKVQNYIFSGTTLVWLVYPKTRSVFVWQRGAGASLNVEEFNHDASLSGGTVLPDFTLAVKDIFPD